MTKWDKFFDKKIREIANEKEILDIGGGFKFQKGLDKYRNLFKNSNYKTLDSEKKYNPDIVGDVCDMSLKDESVDAIICKAVLEHVSEPQKAVKEIYRILRKGGKCFVYVPFLYPYHAHKGVYKDYYRYTEDGIKYLFRKFKSIETCSVRGNLETVFNLTPLRKIKIFIPLIRFLDKFFSGKQTSGYNIFLVK
ncbi:class I SAM-dependent methyltransferase [Patescibacteria group bacterium]|nr:class I SAM-dependent methyltransferase [Patescibacteria group bacterium]